MKTVLQILLFIVAVVLSFFIYKSIQRPIQFEKAKKARYDVTVQRLKDIRKAELAYKDVYRKFTGSWDTLINFIVTVICRHKCNLKTLVVNCKANT